LTEGILTPEQRKIANESYSSFSAKYRYKAYAYDLNQRRAKSVVLARTNNALAEYTSASYQLARALNAPQYVAETGYAIGSGKEPVLGNEVSRKGKVAELALYLTVLKGTTWALNTAKTNALTPIASATPIAPKYQNVVFRGDSRSPAEIVQAGKMSPRGTNYNLLQHAESTGKPSVYIATSQSVKVAMQEPFAKEGDYVYVISRPLGGVDVNKWLGATSPYPSELEIAIPGGIDLSQIISVFKLGPNNTLIPLK
jgi:hypothetical protein